MASWNEDQLADARAALNAVSEQFNSAARNALERHGLDPDAETWPCPTCGENPARMGFRCASCTRQMKQDRLERESGR